MKASKELAEKLQGASFQYDMFYSAIFDAFWRFEVDVNFDHDLRSMALDGLVYTAIKIIKEQRGVESALATLDTARDELIV
jgi:hypothetical protein